MKHFLVIFLLLMAGCVSRRVDPQQSISQVGDEVCLRTGEAIEVGNQSSETIHQYLQEKITLERAVRLAIINNRGLQALYKSLGVSQAQLVQAGLVKNPVLSFAYRYYDVTDAANIIEMSFMESIIDILMVPLRSKMACYELEMTKTKVIDQIIEVITDVKEAFYLYQTAEGALHLKHKVLQVADASFDMAERLRKIGNITELDLLLECSFYKQAKVEVANAELAVLEAKEKLNRLMGLWGEQTSWKAVIELPGVPLEEVSLEAFEATTISNSLVLQYLRNKILMTATKYAISTTEIVFPEMTLGPDSEREDSGVWAVGPGISLSIPIFDLGYAQQAAAKAELAKQWDDYTAEAIKLRSAARVARLQLLNARRESNYYGEVLLPLAEEITKNSHYRYNAMQLGVFDLLRAKVKELETAYQELLSRRDYWLSKTNMEAFLGGRYPNSKRGIDE